MSGLGGVDLWEGKRGRIEQAFMYSCNSFFLACLPSIDLLSGCGICRTSKRAKNHRLTRDVGLLCLRLLDRQHEVCGAHDQFCRKRQQTRDQPCLGCLFRKEVAIQKKPEKLYLVGRG